jgi:iron complex outermembrane receptor protein
MKPNPKISAAVAAILGASGSALVFAQQQTEAASATASTGGELQEVTVTAQRRSENIQDVPITVQAITGAQLQQLNVTNFDSLLKYTPNVTFSGNGPGTGNIFMRGLGGIGSGNQSQSTTAAFPNVALYLDDQSMQFPARNNDVYVVDMERIEVLEGPQGTLFGGGAQAGAIRYITNKPNLNATSGEFNAAYGITAGGDPNSKLNAVLNVPLIPGTLALRAVIFNERQGGYIDNVPGTIGYLADSPQVLAGVNPVANNYQLTANNTNPVTYQGLRLSALWQINDQWNFLIQQNYQNMEADGYFYSYPEAPDMQALQPYQITGFVPAWNKDHYESTAWTLNGDFANGLHAVYTGSYMRREIDAQQDYSNYLRSVVGSFYGCIGPGAGYFNPSLYKGIISPTSQLQCGEPVGGWHDSVDNVHNQQEIRISTNPESRLRGLFGAFWEKFVIYDRMNFNYMAIPQCDPSILATTGADGPYCISAVGPVPGAYASDPSLRTQSDTAFGEDEQRGYKQTAFFISADWDLIPKTLTLSAGTRWYHYDEFEYGSEFYSESSSQPLLINHPNGACTAAGACGFPINLSKSESGTRSRANLTWHITPDIMTYYLFSQGFRPGGFNRTSSLPGQPPSLAAEAPYIAGDSATKQYLKPVGYNSDNLINNEIGFKSELLDHHLLFNVSAYYMHWNDIQLSLFDPVHLGNTTFNVNGPSYNIKGFEVQFVARITEGLTLEGSSSVNSPSQSNAPCLVSAGVTAKTPANPTPAGACITQINSLPYTNPFGELGTRPAFSPPWQFNVRMRYDWTAADYHPFAWVGASHTGPMSNEPASFPSGDTPTESPPTGWPTTTLLKYEIPGYTTYDGALGVARDQWTAQFTASNFTNVYGPSNITSGQFIKSEIPLRPRVLMLQIGYRF